MGVPDSVRWALVGYHHVRGSGGDTAKTRAVARRGSSDGGYLVSGQKHFGSGSGITSFMITMAVAEGESEPDIFFMDMRDVPWDGSTV